MDGLTEGLTLVDGLPLIDGETLFETEVDGLTDGLTE
jgi:hypothetical protein